MADPLSPADRSSLNAERGPINMAMIGAILLESGPGLTYDALCRRIEERIHLIPRYRQRLEQPGLGLMNPVWVDDEHFDVRWHVRHAALPEPAGEAELADYIGREASRKMDRSRPLWEMHLIENMAGGRVAVVPKMHHALVDGVAAVGVATILVDPGPEPLPVEPPGEEWEPQPYRLRRHVARLAQLPLTRGQKVALQTAEWLLAASPTGTAQDLRRATELVTELALSRPDGPPLPINRQISANRSYAMTRTPLDAIKAAGKAADGTINDAILAAISGMLAGYLREAGIAAAELERDPVALVPVSVRREEDETLGNRISVVFVDLPVGEPDPRRRIGLLNERMTAIKGSAKVAAGALAVDMTGFAPPLLASIMARAGGGSFNLVVSNVPGPQIPLYMNGSRILAIHPAVPLNPADQGLAVGVFSYDGAACFGLSADRDLDPPVERARAALDAALEELIATV